MRIALADRVAYITRILKQKRFKDIRLKIYKPGVDAYSGFFRIYALINKFRVYITELLIDGRVLKYSYVLLHDDEVILRYDNAPHHPEVPTYPNHKHVRGRIKPLYKSEIKEFINEAIELVKQGV